MSMSKLPAVATTELQQVADQVSHTLQFSWPMISSGRRLGSPSAILSGADFLCRKDIVASGLLSSCATLAPIHRS